MLRTLRIRLIIVLGLALACIQCNGDAPARKTDSPPNGPAPKYGYQIVNIYPHDSNAFTQGLILQDGKLLESTGQEGFSSLRRVELETGKVLQKVDVPVPYFAEGIAVLNGKVYQLTWQDNVGFIYDAQTFQRVGTFNYEGEGWGLTTDGQSLILSDGSNRIRFIDPSSFRVTRSITVLDARTPVNELNELEYINGEIYANIWHQDRIATIDPQSGRVTSWIDLSGLMPEGELRDPEAVLNGIAWDQANNKLFVTGKLWPRLFEIKVKH
ncbi:MAG TPA: glutaminyl-peptide cyclotransferase [Pyrinomonadaceae bacterium]